MLNRKKLTHEQAMQKACRESGLTYSENGSDLPIKFIINDKGQKFNLKGNLIENTSTKTHIVAKLTHFHKKQRVSNLQATKYHQTISAKYGK